MLVPLFFALLSALACLRQAYPSEPPVLPPPTGPYAIATLAFEWTDPARPDPVTGAAGRPLPAQVWYPATAAGEAPGAPYVSPRLLQALLSERYFEQDEPILRAMARVTTHAPVNLPPAESGRPFPVVVFSHGLGMSRSHSTSLYEELASHGYAVLALDHPYGGLAVLSDGRVLSTSMDAGLEEEGGFARRTVEWAADVSFALDRLAALPEGHPLHGKLALERVGACGHSMGGAAALLAACEDERVVAAADMDGGPFELEERGLCAPTLVLESEPDYSDAELEAKGRTRAGWEEKGKELRALWAGLQERGGVPLHFVSVRGTGHLSFSDAPFVMPDTITRFGGRVLAPERTHGITTRWLLAFFGHYLGGEEPGALEAREDEPAVECWTRE